MKLRKKGWFFERGAALETGSSQSKLRGNILCVRRERVSESNEKVFVKGDVRYSDLCVRHINGGMARSCSPPPPSQATDGQRDRELLLTLSLLLFECAAICDHAGFSMC